MLAPDADYSEETRHDPVFERMTELVTKLLDAPVSILTLIDEGRAFFRSAGGTPPEMNGVRSVPLTHSLCHHVIRNDREFAIPDTRADPRTRENKMVTEFGVAAYLGSPVHRPDGSVYGAISAASQAPRNWTDKERGLLASVAKAIEAQVALREALVRQERMLEDLRAAHAAIDATRDIDRELDDRSRFFTSLSHEIRTPLNGVLGGISLFEIAKDESSRREYAALIRQSATDLTDFIDDLVRFARDSSGRGEAVMEIFDPCAPIEAAVRLLTPAAAEKGLYLNLEIAPDIPESWLSDERRIERLLMGLGCNAIKYTNQGSVTLGLARAGARLTYRVSDTGPGVGAAFRERIFEPFDRGDPDLTRKSNGRGLGLALARRSARLLGATLRLEPGAPAGAGAAFVLAVPQG